MEKTGLGACMTLTEYGGPQCKFYQYNLGKTIKTKP